MRYGFVFFSLALGGCGLSPNVEVDGYHFNVGTATQNGKPAVLLWNLDDVPRSKRENIYFAAAEVFSKCKVDPESVIFDPVSGTSMITMKAYLMC